MELTAGIVRRSSEFTPRILIGAEYGLFREGLRIILEEKHQFIIIGEEETTQDAVQRTYELKPDALVLDLKTPGAPWAYVLKELAAARLPTSVVGLTTPADYPSIVKMVDLGLSALLLKDCDGSALRRAVWAVINGAGWPDHAGAVHAKGLDYMPRSAKRTHRKERNFGLTPREIEVVLAVTAGYGNKDIARRFGITETTVKHHLTNIFDKIGASSRLELAAFANHHGLGRIDIDSAARPWASGTLQTEL